MSIRLPRHEQTLLDELKRRLPEKGDRLSPHRDGNKPWTLDDPSHDRPRGWNADTFYSLADRGLIGISVADGVLEIELGKYVHLLSAVQIKALRRLSDRICASPDSCVALQAGAHRMRYMPGDVLGTKEETYRALQDAGLISIAYSSSGSIGAWTVRLVADRPEATR